MLSSSPWGDDDGFLNKVTGHIFASCTGAHSNGYNLTGLSPKIIDYITAVWSPETTIIMSL